MKKAYFPAVLLCFMVEVSFGQANYQVTNLKPEFVSPATPDVAALGRFGMQPPDYSSGQVQVSIPLYELKEDGLSFPINLNYSYTGFRVKEESSWIGLGWTLSADAIVTRIVKDAPDNSGHLLKKFDDYDQSQIPLGYASVTDNRPGYTNAKFNLTANRLLNRLEDGKPDVFVYNFNGYTGRFIYVKNKAYPLPYNDLIIQKTGNTFVINTPDGVEYTFEESDNSWDWGYSTNQISYAYSLVGFVTTWRLKRVENCKTKTWMEFYYNGYSHHEKNYSITNAVTFYSDNTAAIGGQLRYGGEVWDFMNTTSTSKYLDRIETNNTIVKFIPENRLDFPENKALRRIEVYHRSNPSVPVKKYQLYNNSYFGTTSSKESCWLKLDKLEEVSISGEVKVHKFEYENANGNKKHYALDHWGYFNNVQGNQSLIPKIDAIMPYEPASGWPFSKWANRQSNFQAAKSGSLKKITYPTGGDTEFFYQSAGGRGMRIERLLDNSGDKTIQKFYSYFPDDPVKIPKYKFTRNNDLFYIKGSSASLSSDGSCYNPSLGKDTHSRDYLTVTGDAKTTLDAYDDVTNYYTKVTEFIGSAVGIGGKTEYEFQKDLHSGKVFLKSKKEYAYNKAEPVKIEETIYKIVLIDEVHYWGDPVEVLKGVPIECSVPTGYNYPPSDPHYPSILLGEIVVGGGTLEQRWYQIEKTSTTLDEIAKNENYFYHTSNPPKHTYPIRVEQQNSDAKIIKLELFHPGDFVTSNIPDEMWKGSSPNFKYCIEPIVKLNKYVNNQLVYSAYNIYEYSNNLILAKSSHEILSGSTGEVVTEYFYNNTGNILSIKKNNDSPVSFLWGYSNSYPIAEIKNANPSEFFYTSFEEDGVDFTGSGGVNLAKTGKKVKNSSSYTFPASFNPPAGKSYKMSYWYYNGTTWIFSKERDFTRTISQSGATRLDEIRVYPVNSQMKTFTYNPLIGITSIADDNNYIHYYEYDDLGRLKFLRDQDNNIVKTYEYNYMVK